MLAVGLALVLALALRSNGSSGDAGVRIEPAEALLDAPLRLRVDGAHAGERVRLELSATSADGVEYSSGSTPGRG